jgi:hypothetical protein
MEEADKVFSTAFEQDELLLVRFRIILQRFRATCFVQTDSTAIVQTREQSH